MKYRKPGLQIKEICQILEVVIITHIKYHLKMTITYLIKNRQTDFLQIIWKKITEGNPLETIWS